MKNMDQYIYFADEFFLRGRNPVTDYAFLTEIFCSFMQIYIDLHRRR